jgi:hypothetical protein
MIYKTFKTLLCAALVVGFAATASAGTLTATTNGNFVIFDFARDGSTPTFGTFDFEVVAGDGTTFVADGTPYTATPGTGGTAFNQAFPTPDFLGGLGLSPVGLTETSTRMFGAFARLGAPIDNANLFIGQVLLEAGMSGTATLQLFDTGGNVAQSMTATFGGTGGEGVLAGADFNFNADDPAFGSISYALDFTTMEFMLSNTGNADLTINSIGLTDTNSDGVNFSVGDVSGQTIAAGGSLMVPLTYLGIPNIASIPPGTTLIDTLNVSSTGGDLALQISATVPEPSTIALAGLALVGLVGFARRR